MNTPGFGSLESPFDYRTITHEGTMASPVLTGGADYNSSDIEHQHVVGICTAAATVMNAQKALGKKFSIDFQYLMQKRYDQNWLEGSSIFCSLRVGKNIGFLPAEHFSYVTEQDRELPYAQYIAKLIAIPDTEITRLIALCSDKLAGYAQVDVMAPEYVQKAILDSKAGILMRYVVGKEWFTSPGGQTSWDSADIDPLRYPEVVISGHAINGARFVDHAFRHPNSWGVLWNDHGTGTTNFDNYKPTEAWIPYYDTPPVMVTLPAAKDFKHHFATGMRYGEKITEVESLQIALMIGKWMPLIKKEDLGYYGAKTASAVLAFQKEKTQLSTYERLVLRGKAVGPKTLAALNLIYNK